MTVAMVKAVIFAVTDEEVNSMDKDIIISLRGCQVFADEDANVLELVTEGRYCKNGQTYYITYDESEVTGMKGTTTTLKIDDGIVTIMRFGSVNSQLVFQQGQRHISYYDTTYGAFTIGIFANEVNVDINDFGGEIKVDYQLDIDNNKSGKNDFHMLYRMK